MDIGSICGTFPLNIILSGECFTAVCSNKTAINNAMSTLLNYIETTNPVSIPPGGNLTLKHVNRFCSSSVIVLLECILIFAYCTSFIDTKRHQRKCYHEAIHLSHPKHAIWPSYFAASTFRYRANEMPTRKNGSSMQLLLWARMDENVTHWWQRRISTPPRCRKQESSRCVSTIHCCNGNAFYLIVGIYDNLLPQCLLPLGCGINCTLGLQVAMYTCLDYVNYLSTDYQQGCQVCNL